MNDPKTTPMLTSETMLRDLLDALPKTEYWTPKLHAAEKAARAFLESQKPRKRKK